MDAQRIGADVRLLRRQKRWTQSRLGAEVGATRWVISEIECGRGDRVAVGVLDAVVRALGAALSVRVLYHGEALDRLRDRAHARLVEVVVGLLVATGWQVATEVTFNEYGERGSIDILAFHSRFRVLLVIEVKTVVPDLGGMLATLDRKVRLAPRIARARGWGARTTAYLLVLPDSSTPRRRVDAHAATFATAFPARSDAVRRWLRRPEGPLHGLIFLSDAGGDRTRRRDRS